MEWEMGSLEFTTNACEHPSLTVSQLDHVYLVFTSGQAQFCRQNLMHGQLNTNFQCVHNLATDAFPRILREQFVCIVNATFCEQQLKVNNFIANRSLKKKTHNNIMLLKKFLLILDEIIAIATVYISMQHKFVHKTFLSHSLSLYKIF